MNRSDWDSSYRSREEVHGYLGNEGITDQQAWRLLPDVSEGIKGRLPNWVKTVALQTPRTAAAMLELDAVQRTEGPLAPALNAKLRWIIAHANHCTYGKSVAIGDLLRAGGSKLDVTKSLEDPKRWPDDEADAFHFVQQLSTEAPAISDDQFETLRKKHGDRGVAAMVLLTAYGNFQDRLLLGLQVPLETDGPLPPSTVKFAEDALQRTAILPPANGQAVYSEGGRAIFDADQQWISVSYAQLQSRLERQRDRQPRLPIPTWDEIKTKLPKEMTTRPTSIGWSLVTYGYAPELAICMVVSRDLYDAYFGWVPTTTRTRQCI